MLKIVFFGTPQYTLPVLYSLHKSFKVKHESPIVAVVTRKPKPVGRKGYLKYSAIDTWAHKRSIPVLFSSSDLIKKNIKADIGILASYGEIVPKDVLKHFPNGILNIHPSLLPKYRGSSPVQAAIIAEDNKTGSTIIKLDEKLDHGPIVDQFTENIKSDDTTKTLRERLFTRSAKVMETLIPAYIKGKVNLTKQVDEKAIYTTLIKKDDGFIEPLGLKASLSGKMLEKNWVINFIKDYVTNYSPITIHRFIRAMQPWPIAWSKVKIKDKKLRIKILKSHLEKNKENSKHSTKHNLVLDEVQLEGKNPVSWKQFKEGYPEAEF